MIDSGIRVETVAGTVSLSEQSMTLGGELMLSLIETLIDVDLSDVLRHVAHFG